MLLCSSVEVCVCFLAQGVNQARNQPFPSVHFWLMRPSPKITLKMEVIGPSETSVDFEICDVTKQNSYRHDNHKSNLNINFIALIKNVFVRNFLL